jgi:transposase
MIPAGVQIYVCTQAMDMRRGFNGLEIAVRGGLGLDPKSGGLFVFFNRRADQIRIFFWDRNGYAIFAKRLEGVRFRGMDAHEGVGHLEIDSHRLLRLLDDVLETPSRAGSKATSRPKLELLTSS